MKKALSTMIVFILLFTLTGCINNKEDFNSSNRDQDQATETEKGVMSEEFVPRKAVPHNIPVYPGAILVNDIASYGDNSWQWLYDTTGSGNEIINFFTTALRDLGLEINEEGTLAIHEEFFVATTNSVVSVYWLNDDELGEGVNPDTPGRGYAIIVNLDEWTE